MRPCNSSSSKVGNRSTDTAITSTTCPCSACPHLRSGRGHPNMLACGESGLRQASAPGALLLRARLVDNRTAARHLVGHSEAVIPTRKDQPRDEAFDAATYRKRNLIERVVGWFKGCRA